MRRKLTILFILFFHGYFAFPQNTLEKAADLGRIAMTPVIVSSANIPSYAVDLIEAKLVQAVTRNGLGSHAYDQRFIITANFVEILKDMTATAPPMVSIILSPTLYIGDIETGNLYSSCTLPNLRGVGTNDARAYLSAINAMSLNTEEVAAFIECGKKRIIEFYNSQIDFLLSRANALANQEEYDEASAILLSVPDVCKDAYDKANQLLAEIFQKEIDRDGADLLNKAYQAWNSNQSYQGAEQAAMFLAQIHPFASCLPEAYKLSNQIADRLNALDSRAWNFKMLQYQDEQDLINKQMNYSHDEVMTAIGYEQARDMAIIEAAREVGVARANQPVTYNYNDLSWW